jgi:ATP-binding cassette subfamily F protein 3
LISHDRYFLDKIVGRVIELKEGNLTEYLGNYSDYLTKRKSESKAVTKTETKERFHSVGRKTKDQKRLEAEARQSISKERNRLEKEIEEIENKIESLEVRKKEIETEMTRPGTYRDARRVVTLQREYAQIKEDLENFYSKWEESKMNFEDLLAGLDS